MLAFATLMTVPRRVVREAHVTQTHEGALLDILWIALLWNAGLVEVVPAILAVLLGDVVALIVVKREGSPSTGGARSLFADGVAIRDRRCGSGQDVVHVASLDLEIPCRVTCGSCRC
jgi:hypothetical protein